MSVVNGSSEEAYALRDGIKGSMDALKEECQSMLNQLKALSESCRDDSFNFMAQCVYQTADHIGQMLPELRAVCKGLTAYAEFLESGNHGGSMGSAVPLGTTMAAPTSAGVKASAPVSPDFMDNGIQMKAIPGMDNGWCYSARGHFDTFCDLQTHGDDYHYVQTETSDIVFVRASDIEGVYLSKAEVNNPQGFWTRNGRDGYSVEALMAKSECLSELKQRYEAGESIDSLMEDKRVGEAAKSYFGRPVSVTSFGSFYLFEGDGRHRTLAAQSKNTWIPVIVKGTYERKEQI